MGGKYCSTQCIAQCLSGPYTCIGSDISQGFHELVIDKSSPYDIIAPFGAPAGAESVLSGIQNASSKPVTAVRFSEDSNNMHFGISAKCCVLENWIKTLFLTDSACAYSPILRGDTHSAGRRTRLTLSAVRGVGRLIAMSAIGNDFNIPDDGRSVADQIRRYYRSDYVRAISRSDIRDVPLPVTRNSNRSRLPKRENAACKI